MPISSLWQKQGCRKCGLKEGSPDIKSPHNKAVIDDHACGVTELVKGQSENERASGNLDRARATGNRLASTAKQIEGLYEAWR